jgi:hypothetical protein
MEVEIIFILTCALQVLGYHILYTIFHPSPGAGGIDFQLRQSHTTN